MLIFLRRRKRLHFTQPISTPIQPIEPTTEMESPIQSTVQSTIVEEQLVEREVPRKRKYKKKNKNKHKNDNKNNINNINYDDQISDNEDNEVTETTEGDVMKDMMTLKVKPKTKKKLLSIHQIEPNADDDEDDFVTLVCDWCQEQITFLFSKLVILSM